MKPTPQAAFAAVVMMCAQSLLAAPPSPQINSNGEALRETLRSQPAEDDQAELAKKLQNPVSNLISVPFQNNFDFNLGPNNDGFRYTLNFQPVVPISLGKGWSLIVRTIVPFIYQDDAIPGTSQTGLSDITQSFFVKPNFNLGGWTIAVGPVFLWPSATDDLLGSEKWGAGPTGILLRQEGGWTYGILANHIWSYAGNSHRAYVSSTFLQPFLSYTTKTHTTFGVNTESSYDWRARQWTVPINVSVSQLTKIGKLPVQFALGGKVYAEGPSGGPEWGLRFTVTPLFPEGSAPPAPHTTSAK